MILAINLGSASKKYALYGGGRRLALAHFERDDGGFKISLDIGEAKDDYPVTEDDYEGALSYLLRLLIDRELITDEKGIKAAAIRVVAPGSYFTEHRLIGDEYERRLASAADIAPLHLKPVLTELAEVRELLPEAELLGASDSAFHSTMPAEARRYAIPEDAADEQDIYRFGYHGLSMESVARGLKKFPGPFPERTIVCHIGSGVSVTALRDGKSADTSMGFTPLEGVPMGSRSGSLDPEAALFLQKRFGFSPEKISHYLNTEAGLLGLSGSSGDIRELLELEELGDERAKLALSVFVYRLKQYIGAYMVALGGLDCLVFTGTAGERSPVIRARVCAGLSEFGLALDGRENELYTGEKEGFIQEDDAAVKIGVILADEMEVMNNIAGELL